MAPRGVTSELDDLWPDPDVCGRDTSPLPSTSGPNLSYLISLQAQGTPSHFVSAFVGSKEAVCLSTHIYILLGRNCIVL